MERKGLRVNAGKSKVMQCRVSRYQIEDSREYTCGVCRKGVRDNSILCNSILCMQCLRWVHKRCSGISGRLQSNIDFHCRRCLEGENDLFQSVLQKEVVIEPNVKLRVGFYPGKTGFAQPTGKNWVKPSLNKVKQG